ncbi:MAG: type VI secretion system tube protein Hcp [Verrucomicrobiae bacterium]|nr:type VI secretion system tube protein Hcp [Verrucomicrobiae bacterium]
MNRLLLLLLLVWISTPSVNAALTGFMKVGDIKGESTSSDHEEEIDIHDVSWVISRPLEVEGSVRTRGNAQFGDLVATHRIDKATPKLFEACANGASFPEVIVTFRKDSGEAHLDYLVITLTNVTVTSYEILGGGTAQVPDAKVGFAYEKLKVVYNYFDESGSFVGIVETSWDVVQATP